MSFSTNLLWKTEYTPKVWSSDDGDVPAVFQVEEMVIIRHYEVGLAVNSAFENAVVVGIGGDEIKCCLRDDNFCDLGNQTDVTLNVRFGPCEIRPEDLGDFPNDGCGDEYAIPSISRGIPQLSIPALRAVKCRDVDIRVEDDSKKRSVAGHGIRG
jgi:hypothetical protein